MRKTRVLALVVASLVSTASFAGAQAPAARPQGGRHAMGPGMEGRRGERGGALRGLKLSDAEKTKVQAINTKYAAEGKTLRESMKPAMQEARALRQKGDTAGLRALWDKNKGGRDQMQALQVRQQAEIRTALTPENQKLFDANVQKVEKRRAEWAKNGKAGGHGGRRGAAKVG
jgi:Spy/CpxP family protein refolding chaperone